MYKGEPRNDGDNSTQLLNTWKWLAFLEKLLLWLVSWPLITNEKLRVQGHRTESGELLLYCSQKKVPRWRSPEEMRRDSKRRDKRSWMLECPQTMSTRSWPMWLLKLDKTISSDPPSRSSERSTFWLVSSVPSSLYFTFRLTMLGLPFRTDPESWDSVREWRPTMLPRTWTSEVSWSWPRRLFRIWHRRREKSWTSRALLRDQEQLVKENSMTQRHVSHSDAWLQLLFSRQGCSRPVHQKQCNQSDRTGYPCQLCHAWTRRYWIRCCDGNASSCLWQGNWDSFRSLPTHDGFPASRCHGQQQALYPSWICWKTNWSRRSDCLPRWSEDICVHHRTSTRRRRRIFPGHWSARAEFLWFVEMLDNVTKNWLAKWKC